MRMELAERIHQLERNADAIRSALDPGARSEFTARLDALAALLERTPGPAEALSEQLSELLRTFPAAAPFLDRAPPDDEPRSPPVPGSSAAGGDVGTHPAAGAVAPPPPARASSRSVPDGAAPRWTPEQWFQLLRELVTSALAIVIVVSTVAFAWHSSTLVGDATQFAAAKDLLIVLVGLAGVVVGYYFGRVPADARAAQAQESSLAAAASAGRIAAKARAVADQVEDALGAARGAATRGPAAGSGLEAPALQAAVRALRDLGE